VCSARWRRGRGEDEDAREEEEEEEEEAKRAAEEDGGGGGEIVGLESTDAEANRCRALESR
jgi:hypothetical protein